VTAVIDRDAGRALRNRAPTNRRHALRRFRAAAHRGPILYHSRNFSGTPDGTRIEKINVRSPLTGEMVRKHSDFLVPRPSKMPCRGGRGLATAPLFTFSGELGPRLECVARSSLSSLTWALRVSCILTMGNAISPRGDMPKNRVRNICAGSMCRTHHVVSRYRFQQQIRSGQRPR
jgi:hypothetical protein